jgi:hypothetical protein
LGLASCFVKTEEGLEPVEVIEPISSASLEAILKGIPTSYKMATATDLQGIFQDDRPQIPPEFPSNAQFCQDFTERLIAAARTYKSSPSGQDHIPLGTVRRDFNFSVERKRVLNAVNVVRTEDNVKQHPHTHQAL